MQLSAVAAGVRSGRSSPVAGIVCAAVAARAVAAIDNNVFAAARCEN
jgi:hypothetical protein